MDTVLTDGSPVTPDHAEINPATGQQKGYVVLTAAERAKIYFASFFRISSARKFSTLAWLRSISK